MLKKTIKFNGFDGKPTEETWYFNLTEVEVTRLDAEFEPGLGDALVEVGKLDAAVPCYEKALEIDDGSLVLDVACGAGASSIALAKEFGCSAVGVDLSEENLERARKQAEEAAVDDHVQFLKMDAEDLDFEDGGFDAVVTECALCTFPDKPAALFEAFRMLHPGGRIGITDVVVERDLPEHVQGVLFHVACISGAMPAKGYIDALEAGGFVDVVHEDHGEAITELLDRGERLLMGWGVVEKLYGVDLEAWLGLSQEEAKEMLAGARKWVENGDLSYGLFTGTRS